MKTVSIIVSCFNNSRAATHMSMLCLDHIRKFTDPPYELIVVDPIPKFLIRDDYHTLHLEDYPNSHWLKLNYDPGYTGGMNLGAELAHGEVLVFIQNDVFVREGWLKDMMWYIENAGLEAVWPDQVPRDRRYVLESYARPHNHPDAMKGGRDAGLLMITKEAFERTGRWNEQMSLLAEKDFFHRMSLAHVRAADTNKVFITHVMAATNLDLLDNDPDEYNRRMKADADKQNG